MRKGKPTLNYSSPAMEQVREAREESERREGIENYNLGAFGVRRPFVSAFITVLIFLAVMTPVVLMLPRRWAGLMILLAGLAMGLWNLWRFGWSVSNTSLHRPWRWW